MNKMTIPAYNISGEPPARKVSFQSLSDLLSALELILNTHSDSIMNNDLQAVLTSMHSMLTTSLQGNPTGTIGHYKLLSKYFLDLVRGKKGPKGDFTTRQWDSTHALPSAMVDLVLWYEKYLPAKGPTTDPAFWLCLQVITAFLNGHRVIVTPKNENTSTITAKCSVEELPNLGDKWASAMERLGIKPKEFQAIYEAQCSKFKFNIATAGGPNGQATWSADLDAKAILAAPSLFKSMHEFANLSNLSRITAALVACAPTPLELNPGHREVVLLGRIHSIEEWGGKTRMVAILDYWTQSLLTPLHETVAYFIRRLEQDGTFNQQKIISKVQGWTSDLENKVNSFDLTAATDRIPVSIQVDLLTYLFGSDKLPKLWAKIITDREFMDPSGKLIRYAVGQPMGVKSSFPMLALIHHAIVQLAAIEAKVERYSNYVILGDDNVHNNKAVSERYRLLMNSIGVEINNSKSVLQATGMLPAAEICKRVFINGKELTSIPVKALVKTVRFGHLSSTLQTLFVERGLPVSLAMMPEFFAGFIDKRSLQGLLLLNKVPSEVSGLPQRMDVSTIQELDYSKWFSNLVLTDEVIIHAFTFALVSEQLKRVDGLLRSTMLMSETIKTMARPDPKTMWPVQLFESMNETERAKAISKLPELTFSHPIVHASQAELERVVSHLAALRAGSVAMQQKAKVGLLDLLRNNLSEIWMGEAEKANTVRRSIFNAMLAVLKRMDSVKPAEGKARSIEFSIQLTYVQRSWSVFWELGSAPRLNAVKTKISVNSKLNRTKLDMTFQGSDIKNIRR